MKWYAKKLGNGKEEKRGTTRDGIKIKDARWLRNEKKLLH